MYCKKDTGLFSYYYTLFDSYVTCYMCVFNSVAFASLRSFNTTLVIYLIGQVHQNHEMTKFSCDELNVSTLISSL